MATYYFHDSANQIVFRLGPVLVSEQRSNHRPPRYLGCHVSGHLFWVSAKWNKTGVGWRYEFGNHYTHQYDQRDDAARAERFFVQVHAQMGRHEKIDEATYDALAARYAATAKQTPQPEPDPQPPAPSRPVLRRGRRR